MTRRGLLAILVLAMAFATAAAAPTKPCRGVGRCVYPTPTPTVTPAPTPTATASIAPLPTPAPTPSPESAGGLYGSAFAMDAKDNRPVGRIDASRLALRWSSSGGQVTAIALNQRFGPDQADPGKGYSHGTGGRIRVTIRTALDGPVLGEAILDGGSPRTDAEDHRFIPIAATLPAGTAYIQLDSIDPDPVNNWRSFNQAWIGQPDANPRQPLDPTDTLAVLEAATFTGGAWRVVPDNSPVFDVAFASGRHEGQAYSAVITGHEVAFQGSTKVREHFTYAGPTATYSAVALRVQRVSGTGTLTATIAGASGSASVDAIPAVPFSSLTGGRWVVIPMGVTLVSGQTYDLTFATDASLKVMPIRAIDDAPWTAPAFRDGEGQVSVNGGAWERIYEFTEEQDLQFYLR